MYYVYVIQSDGSLATGTELSPTGIVFGLDPSGRFVYVVSGTTVTIYSINSSTGVLTATGDTATTGSNPSVLVAVGIPW